jgi:hypothetical protein
MKYKVIVTLLLVLSLFHNYIDHFVKKEIARQYRQLKIEHTRQRLIIKRYKGLVCKERVIIKL